MWIIVTEAERIERERHQLEELLRYLEEARRKGEARERFIKATTCPHCKRHDPIPPWLM